MKKTISVLDVVTLTQDLPPQKLVRGQMGTVVEQLALNAFEVEFVASDGTTYALLPLRAGQMMVLHYEPTHDAAQEVG